MQIASSYHMSPGLVNKLFLEGMAWHFVRWYGQHLPQGKPEVQVILSSFLAYMSHTTQWCIKAGIWSLQDHVFIF